MIALLSGRPLAWSPQNLPRPLLLRRGRLFASAASSDVLEGPPLLQEARAFFSARGLQLTHAYSAPPGSRTTSRIAVRAGADGRPLIGLFAPGTHDVRPCASDESCHVPHHPAINDALDALQAEVEAGDLAAFDEATATGTLRYLQLSVERTSRRVQVVLVAHSDSVEPTLARFAAQLWERHGGDGGWLHSLWVNLNPTAFNNILSYAPGAWRLLHAPPAGAGGLAGSLVERYASTDTQFVLPPFVFRQANLDGFDKIVAELRAAVPSGARVVEWYAGVGVLGLSLAADAAFVRCSDVNPPREAFEASRALLPADARDRVSYAVGAAKERLDDAVGADVALVDPPRKGLAPELLAALCDDPRRGGPCASVRTLLYVSCGFPALTHDLDALLAAGCWRVRGDAATAYVLFTGANHIETVVVFDRVDMSDLV